MTMGIFVLIDILYMYVITTYLSCSVLFCLILCTDLSLARLFVLCELQIQASIFFIT